MTVLHTISTAGFYGAESVILNLMEALDRIHCRPALATFVNKNRPNTQLADLVRQRGLAVKLIHCNGRVDFSAVSQLSEYARKVDAQVIHSHGYKADLYSFLASRALPVSLVATCHNWTSDNVALTWYAKLDRAILRRFERIAAVSEQVAQELKGHERRERIRRIPNGVPIEPLPCME